MQLATFQNPPPVNSCLSECPRALTTYMLKSCDSPALRQSQVMVSGGGILWEVMRWWWSPFHHVKTHQEGAICKPEPSWTSNLCWCLDLGFAIFLNYKEITLQCFQSISLYGIANQLKWTKAMQEQNVNVGQSTQSMLLTQHTRPKHNLNSCKTAEYLPKIVLNISKTFLNNQSSLSRFRTYG